LDRIAHLPFPVFERRALLHHHRQRKDRPLLSAQLVRQRTHIDLTLDGPVNAEGVEGEFLQKPTQVGEQWFNKLRPISQWQVAAELKEPTAFGLAPCDDLRRHHGPPRTARRGRKQWRSEAIARSAEIGR